MRELFVRPSFPGGSQVLRKRSPACRLGLGSQSLLLTSGLWLWGGDRDLAKGWVRVLHTPIPVWGVMHTDQVTGGTSYSPVPWGLPGWILKAEKTACATAGSRRGILSWDINWGSSEVTRDSSRELLKATRSHLG